MSLERTSKRRVPVALALLLPSLCIFAEVARAESADLSRDTLRKAFQTFEKEAQAQSEGVLKKLSELRAKFDDPSDRPTRKAILDCCGGKDPGGPAIVELVQADLDGQIEVLLKAINTAAATGSEAAVKKLMAGGDFLQVALREPDLDQATSKWFKDADSGLGACLQTQLESRAEELTTAISKAYNAAKDKDRVVKAVDAFKDGVAGIGKESPSDDALIGCVRKREQDLLNAAWEAAGALRGQIALAEDLSNVQKARLALESREQEYLDALRAQGDGPLEVVFCDWGDPPADPQRPDTLTCHNRALLVGGDSVSSIHVRGLPPGAKVTIHASTGEVFPGGWDSADRQAKWDLGSDVLENLDTDAPGSRQINVYLDRLFLPKHRGSVFMVRNRKEAYAVLRRAGREGLSVVTRGSSRSVELSVTVRDGAGVTAVKTADLLLVYRRWSFEAGGFFALGSTVDKEVTTIAVTDKPGQVTVESIEDADKYRQESGAFLTFFPRNYPMLGIGLGFATANGRPASAYFGPAIRLLSFGDRAVLTMSAGRTVSAVRRFPGLEVGDALPSDSQKLTGRLENQLGSYVLVSLGFQFGPVPGGSDR